MRWAPAQRFGSPEESWMRQRPILVLMLLLAWGGGSLLQAALPGWPGLIGASGSAAAAALVAVVWGWRGPWSRSLYFWATAAFFLVGFALNTLLIAFGWAAEQYLLPQDFASIALSFRIGFTGWMAWSLGFLWQTNSVPRPPASDAAPSRAPSFALPALMALAVAGMAGQFVVGLFLHSQAGSELFGRVGTFFSTLGEFGLIAVCVLYAEGNRRQRGLALVLLGLSAGSGLLTGQRAEMFKGLILFVLFLMLRRDGAGQSLRRPTWALAGMLAAFVLLYPVLSQYKMMMSATRQTDSGLDRALLLMETLPSVGGTTADSLRENVGRLMLRLSQVQFGAHLATAGREQWGLLKGRSLYECAIMFAPRFLWPTKPVIGLGPEGYALLGYKEGTGSIVVPVAIDWHLNFDWLGVWIGMVLTGTFVARVHGRLGGGGLLRDAALAAMTLEVCQAGTGLKGLVFPLVIYGGGSLVLERCLMRAPAPASEPPEREAVP